VPQDFLGVVREHLADAIPDGGEVPPLPVKFDFSEFGHRGDF
jgi:hypothetical protein